MNVLRHTEPGFQQRLRALSNASSLFDPTIEERACAIVEAVRTRGDKALLEFTKRFDGARLDIDQLAVSKAELLDASLQADESLRSAIATAAKNIEFFSLKSLRRNWSARNAQGARVGEKFDPFGRVNPGILFAARVAGATEIYKLGGAQAIAAMALGTATLRPVQKVFGPGNA